jgi:hypothetical protein
LTLVVVVDTGAVSHLVWEPRHIAAERSALCEDCLRVVVVVDADDEIPTRDFHVGGVVDDVDLTERPEVTDRWVGRGEHDTAAVRYRAVAVRPGVLWLTDTIISVLVRDAPSAMLTWVAQTEVDSQFAQKSGPALWTDALNAVAKSVQSARAAVKTRVGRAQTDT